MMNKEESAEVGLAKRLWVSGGLECLQIHFCSGGSSSMWHLLYPAGAISQWRSPKERAKWTMAIEEAFENTRFEISSLPAAGEGVIRWASCSVEPWETPELWERRGLKLSGIDEVIKALDGLAGARSVRVKGAGMCLPFCSIEEFAKLGAESSERWLGAKLGDVLGEALALQEKRELRECSGAAEGIRTAPKL